jgi:DNA-directed RNA polymerase subunit omega
MRARQLANGSSTLLAQAGRDKPTVLALREVAAGLVTTAILTKKK